jgi:hypothetical protein
MHLLREVEAADVGLQCDVDVAVQPVVFTQQQRSAIRARLVVLMHLLLLSQTQPLEAQPASKSASVSTSAVSSASASGSSRQSYPQFSSAVQELLRFLWASARAAAISIDSHSDEGGTHGQGSEEVAAVLELVVMHLRFPVVQGRGASATREDGVAEGRRLRRRLRCELLLQGRASLWLLLARGDWHAGTAEGLGDVVAGSRQAQASKDVRFLALEVLVQLYCMSDSDGVDGDAQAAEDGDVNADTDVEALPPASGSRAKRTSDPGPDARASLSLDRSSFSFEDLGNDAIEGIELQAVAAQLKAEAEAEVEAGVKINVSANSEAKEGAAAGKMLQDIQWDANVLGLAFASGDGEDFVDLLRKLLRAVERGLLYDPRSHEAVSPGDPGQDMPPAGGGGLERQRSSPAFGPDGGGDSGRGMDRSFGDADSAFVAAGAGEGGESGSDSESEQLRSTTPKQGLLKLRRRGWSTSGTTVDDDDQPELDFLREWATVISWADGEGSPPARLAFIQSSVQEAAAGGSACWERWWRQRQQAQLVGALLETAAMPRLPLADRMSIVSHLPARVLLLASLAQVTATAAREACGKGGGGTKTGTRGQGGVRSDAVISAQAGAMLAAVRWLCNWQWALVRLLKFLHAEAVVETDPIAEVGSPAAGQSEADAQALEVLTKNDATC